MSPKDGQLDRHDKPRATSSAAAGRPHPYNNLTNFTATALLALPEALVTATICNFLSFSRPTIDTLARGLLFFQRVPFEADSCADRSSTNKKKTFAPQLALKSVPSEPVALFFL